MRKRIFLFVLVFFMSTIGQAYGSSIYSIAKLSNNEIKVESAKFGSNMRVMVEKGDAKYYYSLNNPKEELPVQLGNGQYTVKILQNTTGNSYKVLDKQILNITNTSMDVYLSSSQPVYWEGKDKLVELASLLTKDLKTDKEKVEAVYKYVTKNIKYDYNKINNISTDYVPNVEATIDSKTGICYDYSALFAGILRSQGIHTKLVKGYKVGLNVYHAWNEVYLDGNWVTIDTTFDAALATESAEGMIKLASEYNKVREY